MGWRSAVWLFSLFFVSGCALDTGDDVAAAGGALHEDDAACGRGCETRGPPPPVIFDTDMDFDDAAALAYLCQQDKLGRIDLRAVTVANDGAGTPGSAIRHARCILAECGLTDVPVADGANTGVNTASPELRFAVESVLAGAFATCTESSLPSSTSAAELFVETVRSSRRPLVVLSTGPLTNVADALELDASTPHRHRHQSIARHIRAMYVMGGAVHVEGNLLGTGTEDFDNSQEFNVWIDPAAAEEVFDTVRTNSVWLVPLDATADVPVTPAFVSRLAADQETAEAQLVLRIVQQPITQFGISLGAFYWWDPLAAVATVGDLCTVEFDRDRIAVVQDGPQAGRTVSTPHGAHMQVAQSADQARFERVFLDGLNGRR